MPSVAAYRILAEHESCRRSLQAAQTFLRKPAGETGFFLETSDSHSRVSPALPAKPDRTDQDDKRPCPTDKCTPRNGARLPWSDPLYNYTISSPGIGIVKYSSRTALIDASGENRIVKRGFFLSAPNFFHSRDPPNRFSKRTANDSSPAVSSTWGTSFPKSNLLR